MQVPNWLRPTHFLGACLWLCALAAAIAPAGATAPPVGADPGEPGFADLAERLAPTTVHVKVVRGAGVSEGLQELLRDYSLPEIDGRASSQREASGSGVIVSTEGLVITNHHVIDGARHVVLTLHDKRRYPADVVGTDPRTDVALLRIRGEGPFVAAPMGNSDAVRVGEWVMAVGHPFDFQFTVTVGVVSARGRRNLARREIQDFIQTDAAVNPGNSGGPLFNLAGEVVGINTAIFTPSGGAVQSAGISLAIPVNMAWRVATELRDTGRVARAGLGLGTRDSPPTETDPLPGAEVTRVAPDSPAERAGIRRGDVIVAVDGEPIVGSEDLRALVLARGKGVPLNLRMERGAAVIEVVCTTSDERELGRADLAIPADALDWAGLTLVPATEDRRARYGVSMADRRTDGLLVVAIETDTPGEAAGLTVGDVITEVGRVPVTDVGHLLELVGQNRTALVTFWRGTGTNLAAIAGLR